MELNSVLFEHDENAYTFDLYYYYIDDVIIDITHLSTEKKNLLSKYILPTYIYDTGKKLCHYIIQSHIILLTNF